jgi:predicted TPR repeat methyltransferase
MTQDVPSPEALCDEAFAHLEAGRLFETHRILLQARARFPRHARIHYLLGLFFSDKRQISEALDAFEESLRFAPDNAKAHNNLGSALEQLGRMAEAEAAFRRALELDPGLIPPYINLGHLLQRRGATGQAVAVYEQALARGLDREMFEQYRATAAGQNTRASPQSWVRATFDNFAPAFDERLRSLGYRVPQDLATRLLARIGQPVDILDLGCGTGQCGVALAAVRRRMIGVDLSEKMLQQAARLGTYDALRAADIGTFLSSCATNDYDLVISADVFVYFGSLDEIFRETVRVLRPGGWFAFSTEEQGEADYTLLPTGRYAQSEAYIRRLTAADFALHCADPTVIRMEGETRIMGRLYVLQKTLAAT